MEELKLYLKENPDKIQRILEYYNYHSITINNNEVRFAKIGGDNPSGCRIKLNDNLSATDFTTSYNGDIIGLIKQHTDLSYKEIINTIKTITNKKVNGHHKKEVGIFDDFFNDIYLPLQEENDEIIYDPSILDQYSKYKWNMRFLKDGILPCSQVKFHVGYDENSNRITLPWFNESGELVGCMARLDLDEPTNYKYLPLIAFPKHKFLYGLYYNKEYIKNNRVYIFESEKSVLLGDSLNIKNCVSLGGNQISTTQVEQLLKLGVSEIVLCMDEGLMIDAIKRDIQTIKSMLFMRDVKIGVILDKKNKYLPKDSKASPIDFGKEVFEKLCNNCLIIN
jgi:DNA primase|nr:MAG TPA: DNA primase [Caudoviricetes sp.]